MQEVLTLCLHSNTLCVTIQTRKNNRFEINLRSHTIHGIVCVFVARLSVFLFNFKRLKYVMILIHDTRNGSYWLRAAFHFIVKNKLFICLRNCKYCSCKSRDVHGHGHGYGHFLPVLGTSTSKWCPCASLLLQCEIGNNNNNNLCISMES